MATAKLPNARIALDGRYLDETKIKQAKPYEPGYVSFLSFPTSRHRATVTREHVIISAQAPTVVELYAAGILAPIGTRAVSLEVDGKALGHCVLESIESGERSGVDDVIVPHFRRPPADPPPTRHTP